MTTPGTLHQLATLLDGEAHQSCVIVGSDVISCTHAGAIWLSSVATGQRIAKLPATFSDGPDAIAAAYRRAIAGTVTGVDPYGLAASA